MRLFSNVLAVFVVYVGLASDNL